MPIHFTSSVFQGFLSEMRDAARRQNFRADILFRHENFDIPVFSRPSENPGAPVVLLSAGMHGDEPAGPLSVLEFLQTNPDPDITWLLTPLINPGGLLAGTRENTVGLDLNRSYQLPDPPEIKSQLDWLANQPAPDLFIALHEDWEASGFYFYELHTAPEPPRLFRETVLAAAARHLPLEPGPLIDGNEATAPGWIYRKEIPELPDGLPEASWFIKKGCPASLTFETPTDLPLARRIAANLAAIQAAIRPGSP